MSYMMVKDKVLPLRLGTKQEWPLLPHLVNIVLETIRKIIKERKKINPN